jgi:hypothetical protein
MSVDRPTIWFPLSDPDPVVQARFTKSYYCPDGIHATVVDDGVAAMVLGNGVRRVRRETPIRMLYPFSIRKLTVTELLWWLRWVYGTADGCVNTFGWTHPITGQSIVARINPGDGFRYESLSGGRQWFNLYFTLLEHMSGFGMGGMGFGRFGAG